MIVNTIYNLCLGVILIWRFGGVVPEPPIIMSANNNAETAPWPCFYKFSVAAGLNRQCCQINYGSKMPNKTPAKYKSYMVHSGAHLYK